MTEETAAGPFCLRELVQIKQIEQLRTTSLCAAAFDACVSPHTSS